MKKTPYLCGVQKLKKNNIMSRTYRNYIKCGICYGSNTDFYRELNRFCRNKNKHILRNLLANADMETLAEVIPLAIQPKRDTWNEPTDGTFLISKKQILSGHKFLNVDYCKHKFGKYLKNKKRLNY